MFMTHPGAELHGRLQFGDGTKQWAIIEQQLSIPWLYVCITQTDHCYDYRRMLLVSCVEHFAKLLEDLPQNASVTGVMSVLPNRDGMGLWSMVQVDRIDAHAKDGMPVATVTLANGDAYEEFGGANLLGANCNPLYRAS